MPEILIRGMNVKIKFNKQQTGLVNFRKEKMMNKENDNLDTQNPKNVFGDLESMVFADQIDWRNKNNHIDIDDLQDLSEKFWKEKLQD